MKLSVIYLGIVGIANVLATTTKPSTIKYRNVKVADIKSLAELCTETFEGPFEWHQVLKRQSYEREYQEQLGQRLERMVNGGAKHGMILGECCEDGVVAFVEIGLLPSPLVSKEAGLDGEEIEVRRDVPYLGNVAVSSARRREGIGSKLVRIAEKLAQKWLEADLFVAVEAGNVPALKMYERMGFKLVLDERDNINRRGTRLFFQKQIKDNINITPDV